MSTENQEPKKSVPEEGSDEGTRSPIVQERGVKSSENKTNKTDKISSEKESDEVSDSPGGQDRGV